MSSSDFTGIFRARLFKRSGFGRWFFLVFFSTLALIGLSNAAVDWTGLGQGGRSSGVLIAIISAIFVASLYLRIRKTSGLRGFGVQIDNGQIALMRLQPGSNGAKAPLESFSLFPGSQYPSTGTIAVVNLRRIQNGGWTVSHLALKDVEGNVFIVLGFLTAEEPSSLLYTCKGGRMEKLGEEPLLTQVRSLGELLRPSGARLQLTFTEVETSAALVTGRAADAFGLVGAIGGVVGSAISASHMQGEANKRLEAGQLPVGDDLQPELSRIVDELGYELVPNDEPSLFVESSEDVVMSALPV